MKNKYVFILSITILCSLFLSLASEGLKELNNINLPLEKLKNKIKGNNPDEILLAIKTLEKESEFYVERRMNRSIKSLITGKGIDDII